MAELSNTRTGAMFPQYYAYDKRIQTFLNWKIDSHMQPRELAEAGFLYQGDGDSVICYYCGGELSNWGPGDNAWIEHETFYPSCAHVLLQKTGHLTLGDGHADHESYVMQNSGQGFNKDCELEDSLKETGFDDHKKLEEENKQLRHQFVCATCLQERTCISFLPCSHTSACLMCSQKLQNCNICQRHIIATVRTYYC
ncbi:hypothetical protein ACJMK2_016611 [Sinanodonta woodiana]|uniref:RING-type domain-containing protein n=1 Tax=Sinanodonta woodiana TaxID=1069815 RepID=A0ABD3UUA5_SINWO